MTNSKWFGTSDADPIADIMGRLAALESYSNDVERRFANLDSPHPIARVDPVSYENAYEGQRAIDPADEQHMWYSNGAWRKAVGPPVYHIKVISDIQVITVGDFKFGWAIPQDMDNYVLVDVELDVTTVSSSGIVQVQVRNVTGGNNDMLSTRVQVDAGETHSDTAATQPVINAGTATVGHTDLLGIDVDAAGTGARGLGIVLFFEPPA
jgi:hypothetical protein